MLKAFKMYDIFILVTIKFCHRLPFQTCMKSSVEHKIYKYIKEKWYKIKYLFIYAWSMQ